MIATLKDIHDVTQSAVLMIGEERVDGLLKRFESFYNRFNQSAVVHLIQYTIEDVMLVVQQRCELPVEDKVCTALFEQSGGRSMRTVIDRVREIEAWAMTNSIKQFTFQEWRAMTGRRALRQVKPLTNPVAGEGNA